MKKVLVAGGAGFVASHLCERLLKNSYDVTVIDNLITGQRKNIEPLIKRGVKFVEADINDPASYLRPELKIKFDQIYNMASPASPIDFPRIPIFILETATHGHKNLLQLAQKNSARILFASSSEVYGEAEVHPQVESYFGNVNSFGLRSCYDEAKRVGEALSLAYKKEHKVSIAIARIFNTYGPNMRPSDGRIIPNFFSQALAGEPLSIFGDGHQTRSFCYVTDLVEGLFLLMESQIETPTNLGNPIERSVLEIAEQIKILTKSQSVLKFSPLGENDPKQRRPDISKAQRELGYAPQVNLETGLRNCLDYFKN
jgi:nucleoside-diphosphate-sugar epimerase